jgi:hypothetical protein
MIKRFRNEEVMADSIAKKDEASTSSTPAKTGQPTQGARGVRGLELV